ncbi:MAG: hypothetical protein ABEI99_01605, partial [Halobaculum sp.]
MTVAELDATAQAVADGEITGDILVIENSETVRKTLEHLLVEHTQVPDALRIPEYRPLLRQLGIGDGLSREWTRDDLSESARTYDDGENAVEAVNEIAPFTVRERA